MRASSFVTALCLVAATFVQASAQSTDAAQADVKYATVDSLELKLDLHRAKQEAQQPLIVWVHGGAWRAGSKSDMPLGQLVTAGYPVASVDYRLSTQAQFPAQVHDIKAAIRFLRAKQRDLGINASRIVIAGGSAGGHLAALVGVSNGHQELEGKVGVYLDQRSDVQAIVSFYGMSNLTTILSQSTPHGQKVRVPALQLLLGGQPDEKPELAKLASPVFHVDERDPPLLLIHGDQDPQAPIDQSYELHARYEKAKRPCRFEVIRNGKHGGAEFYDEERIGIVKSFLSEHVQSFVK